MTNPTIICPNWKTEIKLTESLAALSIEATRRDYENRLAKKDSDIAQRETMVILAFGYSSLLDPAL